MFDFSNENREGLAILFEGLCNSYNRMNQLPHEMVAMFISYEDEEDANKLKSFWADYLEYLAKLVRKASPLLRG